MADNTRAWSSLKVGKRLVWKVTPYMGSVVHYACSDGLPVRRNSDLGSPELKAQVSCFNRKLTPFVNFSHLNDKNLLRDS